MPAAATDLLQKVGSPGTATTLSAPGYTVGNGSITVGSTSNWTTDTGVTFAIDQAQVVNGVEVQIAGTYNEYVGTVASGTSVTNVSWAAGSGDRNYSAGALTRVYIPVSAERENRIVEWGTAQHNQDGSHSAVTATSITASGPVQGASVVSTGDLQLRSTSLETIQAETEFDFVASGGVWTGDGYGASRNASMTALVVYINGRRGTVAAVTARTFTASKDTYVDVLNSAGAFSLVYTEVANNAASPALAANSIRLAIIVTGASNIANVGSVNQGEETKVLPIATTPYQVTDSLGNLICPRDPNRRLLGQRRSFVASTGIGTTAVTISLPVPFIADGLTKVVVSLVMTAKQQTGLGSPAATIWDGAVTAGTQLQKIESTGAAATYLVNLSGDTGAITPTAGLHTINVGIQTSANTCDLMASATQPIVVRIIRA